MLVVFRKFAVTSANLKVVAAFLALLLTFFLLTRQEKDIASEPFAEESMGGRENAVTVELASLETEGLSEPEELSHARSGILLFSSYTVQQGDIVGEIASRFGLSISTIVSVNGITNTRALPVGRTLRIPNQDGVFYAVRSGDTLDGIAEKHRADTAEIKAANELFSDKINLNTSLFIPGATAPWEERVVVAVAAPRPVVIVSQRIFDWPITGRITSGYGNRRSPFTRGWSFHDGLDIAAPYGSPITAAMAGRVESVGYDNVYGNFVIVQHSNGYKTLYGHMSSHNTRGGAYVDLDTVIGFIGNTGQSTGPHLHFTVYLDGSSINPRTVLK